MGSVGALVAQRRTLSRNAYDARPVRRPSTTEIGRSHRALQKKKKKKTIPSPALATALIKPKPKPLKIESSLKPFSIRVFEQAHYICPPFSARAPHHGLKRLTEDPKDEIPISHRKHLFTQTQCDELEAKKAKEEEAEVLFTEADKEVATIAADDILPKVDDISPKVDVAALVDAESKVVITETESEIAYLAVKNKGIVVDRPVVKFVPKWKLTMDHSVPTDSSLASNFASKSILPRDVQAIRDLKLMPSWSRCIHTSNNFPLLWRSSFWLKSDSSDPLLYIVPSFPLVMMESRASRISELKGLHRGIELLWRQVEDNLRTYEVNLKIYQDQLFSTEEALWENRGQAEKAEADLTNMHTEMKPFGGNK
ncbi:hypothetical protein NE237_021462 [Protea cynaroides]|uniref:Uncharacterized protein n=1 Tax=Protea cynaroides TaxID=273540 RepID=A0A9Q0H806_9MAGN|nr:hypothetical protein NE237_021462 [Protea cynaroides]